MTVYLFLAPSVSGLLPSEHQWQLLLTLMNPVSDGDVLRAKSLSSVLCDVNKAWLNKSLLEVQTVQAAEMRPV